MAFLVKTREGQRRVLKATRQKRENQTPRGFFSTGIELNKLCVFFLFGGLKSVMFAKTRLFFFLGEKVSMYSPSDAR